MQKYMVVYFANIANHKGRECMYLCIMYLYLIY